MADRFFDLPREVKAKFQMSKSFDGKNGYMGIDFERLEQVEEKSQRVFEYRECFNLYDLTVSLGMDEVCPGLETVYYNFNRRCKGLMKIILRAIAVGLGLEKADILESGMEHAGTSQSFAMLRILNYPPMEHSTGKNIIRCGAHVDYDYVTANFQDIPGLEMLDRKTNKYILLPNIDGTIVIQNGFAIERATGGLLTGSYHRIYPSAPDCFGKRRRAIAYFGQPDHDVLLKNLLAPAGEVDENAITSYDLATTLYNSSFEKEDSKISNPS